MPSNIHPTAIVHPQAQLADDCKIGPYCVVGENVRIGSGTRLQSHVVVEGNLELGANCEIFSFACLGKQTQDLKYQGGQGPVQIGSGTTIREYVTVHMPTAPDGLTRIGENCHILAYSHIAHDCLLGDHVIMSNGTNLAGHVIVEDRVVFGGLCGVHQFGRVGTMAMIGAMCKVAQDIVPYSLVDGNPGVPRSINKIGMKRNGLDDSIIRDVTTAFRLLFRSGLTQEEALTEIGESCAKGPEIEHLVSFVRSCERGLARPKVSIATPNT